MKHAHARARRLAVASTVFLTTIALATGPAVRASASAASEHAAGESGDVVPGVGAPLAASQTASAPPKQLEGVVPGRVILTLDPSTTATGKAFAAARGGAIEPQTSNSALNQALRTTNAVSLQAVFPQLATAFSSERVSARALAETPASARTYVLITKNQDSVAAARALEAIPGVSHAEPDRYVNTMNTGGVPLPAPLVRSATKSTDAGLTAKSSSGVPANYDLASSAQALLNAGGVNAVGAFTALKSRFGQLPGQGEIITNVSIGDLIDKSMLNASDTYAVGAGATTILQRGQRYLDLPSMPLIPTYVSDDLGGLSGTATVEHEDPKLSEVMLDFGVMAPLPHDRQRSGRVGVGYTDMLGIAPGAKYRLVVPQQPTMSQLAGALIAAANQSPRPNVITASIGFGTDVDGFPGRYFEDDPLVHDIVEYIVKSLGIIVSISSNDGTRMYTQASVGPDGGSTPTNVASSTGITTSIDDDAMSSSPTEVRDSGALVAGGTTLDDTLATPAAESTNGTVAETRISGFGTFSSGFGSRVNLSAPSDNILSFEHPVATLFSPAGGPSDVNVVLSGGTSASAPEIAAAAAVVVQSARLAGHAMTPQRVRDLLTVTGRPVSTPGQIDQHLNVGPQIDVTAATETVLGVKASNPTIARVSVAHRVTLGGLGGAFTEGTDQRHIDLGDMASGGTGEGLVGPITFAGDVTGVPWGTRVGYVLTVGSSSWHSTTPAIRLTPTQILTAAHLHVVSSTDRAIHFTYGVQVNGRLRASTTRSLSFGPSNGRYLEAMAPEAPKVVAFGRSVTVKYDLAGVAKLEHPQLVVSTVGHWNPILSPNFSAAWHTDLSSTSGTITVPASVFASGGGIYGIGISQVTVDSRVRPLNTYGEFAPVRIDGSTAADRPGAPLITGFDGPAGHMAQVNRAAPNFSLTYDVRNIPTATSTLLEISAPAPTYSGFNTFVNSNGTTLDDDGVDTGSVAHRTLSGRFGTVRLNAVRLGLRTSEFYNVRVLALNKRRHVVGQASPTDMMELDDGLAPDGAALTGFAISSSDSLAALVLPTGVTDIRRYDPSTGVYGTMLSTDGPGSLFGVLGEAASTHRALIVHQSAQGGSVWLETWDVAAGKLIGRVEVPVGETFVTGKVDPLRSRASILLRGSARSSGNLMAIDLATGAGGPLVPLPPAADVYPWLMLDIASDTGNVSVMSGFSGGFCLGSVDIPLVDMTTDAVASAGMASRCTRHLASDGIGDLFGVTARSANPAILPESTLTTIVGADQTGRQISVRSGTADSLTIDSTNELALTGFPAPVSLPSGRPGGWVSDNNGTAELQVTDLKTGSAVESLAGFSSSPGQKTNLLAYVERIPQLDTESRTAWTYGLHDNQIQQFSY